MLNLHQKSLRKGCFKSIVKSICYHGVGNRCRVMGFNTKKWYGIQWMANFFECRMSKENSTVWRAVLAMQPLLRVHVRVGHHAGAWPCSHMAASCEAFNFSHFVFDIKSVCSMETSLSKWCHFFVLHPSDLCVQIEWTIYERRQNRWKAV